MNGATNMLHNMKAEISKTFPFDSTAYHSGHQTLMWLLQDMVHFLVSGWQLGV